MNKVIFTEPAEYDLLDIEYYIHVRLCNRDAADRMMDGILEQANSLADFPMKCPFVEDELLRAIGIRVAGFENYYIFYIYDAKTLWGTWIQIEENNHHWVWKFEPNGDFY